MVNLKANPYYLDDEGVKWVETTLQSMTVDQKLQQLFCLPGPGSHPSQLDQLVKKVQVGGVMYRPEDAKVVREVHKYLQDKTEIPLLIAANLEAGGNGIAREGTNFGKPIQVAATDNPEMGYNLGKISCKEGAAVGCNWSFAPIVDIDMNFRNPITNTRTFGNDPERVITMASGYMKGAKEEGVAVSIKHFPGDGVDERDQHLVTSVNDLSMEEWDKTYGHVYQTLIDQGAETIMVGHIALPSYQEHFKPDSPKRPIPASLSKEILVDLLRDKMGFNGMTITDASQMVGFLVGMERRLAVPTCIANGCDMILFNKNFDEDMTFMKEGYENGILNDERLNEAVTRILGTKAALKLYKKQSDGTLIPEVSALELLKCEEHENLAKACADEGITLVKNLESLLPLDLKKYKKIYLNVLEDNDAFDSPLRLKMKALFEKEGFEVNLRNREFKIDMEAMMAGKPDQRTMEVMAEISQSVADFKEGQELAVYVANYETASNKTIIRIDWKGIGGMGNDTPWFAAEIPMLFISLANPYHLLDAPMSHAYVNAYTNNDYVLEGLMDKLMGRSDFKGTNPVDPFCGREDTRH